MLLIYGEQAGTSGRITDAPLSGSLLCDGADADRSEIPVKRLVRYTVSQPAAEANKYTEVKTYVQTQVGTEIISLRSRSEV